MKTINTLIIAFVIAIAGVLALSTAASADVICRRCEYAAQGIYLGGL